jgi:hypothetical protein
MPLVFRNAIFWRHNTDGTEQSAGLLVAYRSEHLSNDEIKSSANKSALPLEDVSVGHRTLIFDSK